MDWKQAEAALERSVASVFDRQEFQLLPRATGPAGVNGTRMTDVTREPFAFRGTIEFGPAPMQPGAQYPRGMAATPPGGAGVSHQAVITAHVAGWPYHPQTDDRIGHGDRTYLVALAQSDGSERIAIFVNKARPA